MFDKAWAVALQVLYHVVKRKASEIGHHLQLLLVFIYRFVLSSHVGLYYY